MENKLSLILVFFVFMSEYLFAQTIDKTQYKEIDPYDFVIMYNQAIRSSGISYNSSYNGKYKSTVIFSFNNGPTYYFVDLEGDTTLFLYAKTRPPRMVEGQKVTVYFTFTLDMFGLHDKFLDAVDFL